jgi:hypothetical protein
MVLPDNFHKPSMTHKELQEQITRVSREEEMKKQSLEYGFSNFKRQMMPAAIAKRALKNSIIKIKSFFHHFPRLAKAKA